MAEKLKLLTAKDIAKRLKVTERWIEKACQTGRLPATKVGGIWIVLPEAYNDWKKKRRRKTRNPKAPHQ